MLHRGALDDLAAAVRIARHLRSLIWRTSSDDGPALRAVHLARPIQLTSPVHFGSAGLLRTIPPIPRTRRDRLLGTTAGAAAKSGSCSLAGSGNAEQTKTQND